MIHRYAGTASPLVNEKLVNEKRVQGLAPTASRLSPEALHLEPSRRDQRPLTAGIPEVCGNLPAMTGAKSQATPKSRRRWWIGGGLLLVGVLLIYQWMRPRPIHVPLSDGTTLTISAITTGTEHFRSAPITWRQLKAQFAAGRWEWPRSKLQTPQPALVLWFDGPDTTSLMELTLVDRNGWRWNIDSGSGNPMGSMRSFRQIETDGTARLEFRGAKGLRGSTVLPLATAVPAKPSVPVAYQPAKSSFPPAPPPLTTNLLPPDPYPVHVTDGPLEATLHGVDVRVIEMHGYHVSEGTLRLDTRWNNEPFPPQFGNGSITDQFGRSEPCYFSSQYPFQVQFPPQDAVWSLHVQMFGNPSMPLDLADVVAVTPEFPAGAMSFVKEGVLGGVKWRATVVPSGRISAMSLSKFGLLTFQENAPLLIIESDHNQTLRGRIEAVDRQGNKLPATMVGQGQLPPNAFAFRCPGFDAAQGHTLRVGLESPRLVQFRFRPNVVAAEKIK